jgi:hypothetical protein
MHSDIQILGIYRVNLLIATDDDRNQVHNDIPADTE